MAITVKQKWRSPSFQEGENPSIDTLWIVRGTDIHSLARIALASGTPAVLDGLVRQNYGATPLGFDSWNGAVRYGKRKKKEPGDSSYSFDTRGATQHIVQSLETIGNYAPAGQTAPNFHGAINVTLDAVEGMDIVLPKFAFHETHFFTQAQISDAYKMILYGLTGKVNNATWRMFAKGEVLFLGASGSLRGDAPDDLWEIGFYFDAEANATDIPIGPDFTVPAKEGKAHYLWVRHCDVDDAEAKVLVKWPTSAHVERVCEYGSFSSLGI